MRITHSGGVPEAKVSITGPDGQKVFSEPQIMAKIGDNFEYTFVTNGMQKGKYSGNINAKSGTGTESNRAFEFELKEQT